MRQIFHVNVSVRSTHMRQIFWQNVTKRLNILYETEDVNVNELCHTCEGVMSHMWMSHVTHMNESCHTYEWVMSHIWMSHVTHMNESCHTYEWGMPPMSQICVRYVNESHWLYRLKDYIIWVLSLWVCVMSMSLIDCTDSVCTDSQTQHSYDVVFTHRLKCSLYSNESWVYESFKWTLYT